MVLCVVSGGSTMAPAALARHGKAEVCHAKQRPASGRAMVLCVVSGGSTTAPQPWLGMAKPRFAMPSSARHPAGRWCCVWSQAVQPWPPQPWLGMAKPRFTAPGSREPVGGMLVAGGLCRCGLLRHGSSPGAGKAPRTPARASNRLPRLPACGPVRGCPSPRAGLWERAKAWMPQRSGHAESRGREGRGERPARGRGQPRTVACDSDRVRLRPSETIRENSP
jgi:hypothetical protein